MYSTFIRIIQKITCLLGILVFVSAFQQPKTNWVAIGDSITYLNDHANETGDRVKKGYLTLVTEQLPYLQFVNQGHNGWTAVRIAAEIEKLGLVKAAIYSVFLGTNDWWGGKTLGTLQDYTGAAGNGTVYGSFRIIIDKLRSLNRDAKIILITPMQRADFVYIGNYKNNAHGSYEDKNGQQLAQFAEAVKEIGRVEGLAVIDLYHNRKLSLKHLVHFKRLKDPLTGVYRNYAYPGYIGIPFDPEKDTYPYPAESANMTYDGLHPSDKGNAIIAGELVKVFRKIQP